MIDPEDQPLVNLIFDHLCEEQPEAVAELRDEQIVERIGAGIGRARAHGLDSEGAIAAFVSLLFVVGPRFDEHPKIRKALSDATLPPDERLRRLFQLTSESDWDEAGAIQPL